MEIKKGISQMAEYPNVVINYVVPKSGNMHYVLKDGILDNGVIIATLDPRHAIDEANPCQNIGVFSAFGDILVDFNKKDIKNTIAGRYFSNDKSIGIPSSEQQQQLENIRRYMKVLGY